MNKIFENFRSFCLHNEIEIEDINGFTFRFSKELIERNETEFYLKIDENKLNLIINVDKSIRRTLKGLKMIENEKELRFNKPNSFVLCIKSESVDGVLNEISSVVFFITKFLSETGKNRTIKARALGNKYWKKIYSDDDNLYVDEKTYTKIFGEPDLWLCNFWVKVQRNYVRNTKDVSIFIDNTEKSALILYTIHSDLKSDTTLHELLKLSHLYFNGLFSLTLAFFNCFLAKSSQYIDFTLRRLQNLSNLPNFEITCNQGTEVIEYDKTKTPSAFLKNLKNKLLLSFNSLDVHQEFND